MKKMNPELKAKWVAALRSGDYKQTKGALKKIIYTYNRGSFVEKEEYAFCCLGVLCDIVDRSKWRNSEFDSIIYEFSDEHSSSINIRGPLRQEIGESILNYTLNMNDSYSFNFHKIADWIEENA